MSGCSISPSVREEAPFASLYVPFFRFESSLQDVSDYVPCALSWASYSVHTPI